MTRKLVPYDGNSAVAHVAHATNEVMTIYPITPSSDMGEIADAKSAKGEKNIWGVVPIVAELQSEGGASGAVHGALSAGSLTSTFTASQGLMLMLPNMHKIAGELLPTVFHIAARSLACQALSIFGDHSDVYAARNTGFAMLSGASVQEAMDFALISQAATLESRIPFLHIFEGFRTSHEVQKIEELTKEDMKEMIDDEFVIAHKNRGMSPDRPTLRGTSQNPDVYFQGREAVNKYHDACPAIVQKTMNKFAKLTGRQYKLFEYEGCADAEKVVIIMGCGAETTVETSQYLNAKNEKTGVLKVRLYRPWSAIDFIGALPKTVKKIAVLDRTKEPGCLGEPLYEDVVASITEDMINGDKHFNEFPKIYGGRYGLSSKEYTPAMVISVFENLSLDNPKNHFTVGIEDDVTNTSLDYKNIKDNPTQACETGYYRAMFYGLGSDGTVGANKNSIKIIAEQTDNFAQGYFVYDSKKAGAVTVSHLRFGKNKIRKPYLVTCANFIACHNFSFLEKYNMLKNVEHGGTFLLNSPFSKEEVWDKMPAEVQKQIIEKELKFYVIDGIKLGAEIGLGERINVIMQTAFFKISNVIPIETAVNAIKDAIRKSYGSKGEEVVNMNFKAVEAGLNNFDAVTYPKEVSSTIHMRPAVPENAPEFVQNVTAKIISQQGDDVKVSEMPADGTWPTATTQYEKRNIAVNIPVWNAETCIQCGVCSMVCPHATIRMKAYDAKCLDGAPETFKSCDAKGPSFKDMKFTLQVAPEDCTGCGNCVDMCLKKDDEAIKMMPQLPLRTQEAVNYDFFLNLPETDLNLFKPGTIKGSQFLRPLFEYSGACAGCGETSYVKLLTQLFGDRAIIANATGCSSIYGGNLPTTPYARRADGRGPAWNNSLFEDTAEIAFGMKLSVDMFTAKAFELASSMVEDYSCEETKTLLKEIMEHDQSTLVAIEELRGKICTLNEKLNASDDTRAKQLVEYIDYFVKKSIWGVGGDGWAYDIGYGGLDHVLASGKNVNLLVLDTEVYSNTGGQASKSTPMGAVAKFAAGGKPTAKKDLGLISMTYGNIYVAKVAMGASQNQVVKAFMEAEAYNGPSIILAYSHCIAHGIKMTEGYRAQKKAVDSGHWPLLRFNPDNIKEGKNPLMLDSKAPSITMSDFAGSENRFKVLHRMNPEAAKKLGKMAQSDTDRRNSLYTQLSEINCKSEEK
ncbi:MAG: pyruvate:ferredoxin (flavodoxin) oxidoreductase [Pseudomonadota bacterium]